MSRLKRLFDVAFLCFYVVMMLSIFGVTMVMSLWIFGAW